jgi:thiazole synthase
MELGFDGVLLNSAVAQAVEPARMAAAFAHAVVAGRLGYEAGLVAPQDMARPSTPVGGMPILVD